MSNDRLKAPIGAFASLQLQPKAEVEVIHKKNRGPKLREFKPGPVPRHFDAPAVVREPPENDPKPLPEGGPAQTVLEMGDKKDEGKINPPHEKENTMNTMNTSTPVTANNPKVQAKYMAACSAATPATTLEQYNAWLSEALHTVAAEEAQKAEELNKVNERAAFRLAQREALSRVPSSIRGIVAREVGYHEEPDMFIESVKVAGGVVLGTAVAVGAVALVYVGARAAVNYFSPTVVETPAV